MQLQKLLTQCPEELKKMGAIFCSLNYIEMGLIVFLTDFFSNKADQESEKSFTLNDALFDNGIFPSFENKKTLFNKIIDDTNRVAVEKGIPFDLEKWGSFVKSLQKTQQLRNNLAHHHLNFHGDGKTVSYTARKKNRERIEDHKRGITNASIKRIEIDLDNELNEIDQLLAHYDDALANLFADAETILSKA